jgi:hypothetical protein
MKISLKRTIYKSIEYRFKCVENMKKHLKGTIYKSIEYRFKCVENMKIHLKGTIYKGIDCIKNTTQWRALGDALFIFRIT